MVVVRSANTTESVLFAERTTTINFGNASITNSKIERSGIALRWWLLIVNFLVLVFASAAPLAIYEVFTFTNPNSSEMIYATLRVLRVAPLAVCSLVIAWGPGAVWVRGGLLVAASLAGATISSAAFALTFLVVDRMSYDGSWPHYLIGEWTAHCTTSITHILPMTMFLTLLGAFLRIRLGQVELAASRVRILGVMVATAIVAGLIILNAEARWWYLHQISPDVDVDLNDLRLNSAVIALVSGPIYGVLTAVAAWSASSHVAKLLVVLISIGVFSLYYFAPQTNVMAGLYYGIGLLLIAVWIVFNVRMLARSGWVLSRR